MSRLPRHRDCVADRYFIAQVPPKPRGVIPSPSTQGHREITRAKYGAARPTAADPAERVIFQPDTKSPHTPASLPCPPSSPCRPEG